MTTVYGVTFHGAKDQIEARLRELPELIDEIGEDDHWRYKQLATYVTKLTFASLGEVRIQHIIYIHIHI